MTRWAVVFGSNGPKEVGMLRFAKDDAEKMARSLSSPRCGFEVTTIEETTNPHLINETVAKTAELCNAGDTLLVYFSGHAVIQNSALRLMLDNGSRDRPLTTTVDANWILDCMKYTAATKRILILDCCHAGALIGNTGFKDAEDVTPRVKDIMNPANPDSQMCVAIFASDHLEKAREINDLRGGFLTHSICQALGDSFQEADFDNDNAIDLQDLKRWLERHAEKHNQEKPEVPVPIPFVFGRERGRLFLTRDPELWKPCTVVGSSGIEFVVLPLRFDDYTAWLIGKTPVTNAQFRKFSNAIGHPGPVGKRYAFETKSWEGPFRPWQEPEFSDPEQPVVCVDFATSRLFAEWIDSIEELGKVELVPMQVWDFAAFGSLHPSFDKRRWSNYSIHQKCKAPASMSSGHLRTHGFGAEDLFGNVWEWTINGIDAGHQSFDTPTISCGGNEDNRWFSRNQQIRGGSFLDDLGAVVPVLSASSTEEGLKTEHCDLGFRLAIKASLHRLPTEVCSALDTAPTFRLEDVEFLGRVMHHISDIA